MDIIDARSKLKSQDEKLKEQIEREERNECEKIIRKLKILTKKEKLKN